MQTQIIPVNGLARAWTRHRYILAFGAYGDTRLMVWANSLDDALEEACDWIVAHAPGLLMDDAVSREYELALSEGLSEEQAIERAEMDMTCFSHSGLHYIASWEWLVVAEDPTRDTILRLEGRCRLCRDHYRDLGPCDQRMPVASPHR